MAVDRHDRLVGLVQDGANQVSGTQQFCGAANLVALCLAFFDHQQRRLNVRCEGENVCGGQQRRKVETTMQT
jgi:hypothetical protein